MNRSIALIALLLLAAAANAGPVLQRSVMGSGGTGLEASGYLARSTLGQTGIGHFQEAPYELTLGFWSCMLALPVSAPEDLPSRHDLSRNWPNPFNPSTTLRYALPEEGPVSLRLYDLRGREVRTILDEGREAGWHEITIRLDDLPSGVYWARMTAPGFTKTRKLVLVK